MKNQKTKKRKTTLMRAKNTRDDETVFFFFSLCTGVFGKRTREREKETVFERPRGRLRGPVVVVVVLLLLLLPEEEEERTQSNF